MSAANTKKMPRDSRRDFTPCELAGRAAQQGAPETALEDLRRVNMELRLRLEAQSIELSRAKAALQQQLRERGEIKSAFLESEQRFMAFMDHSPTLAFMKDEQGCYVYGNLRCKSTFGKKFTTEKRCTDFDLYPRKTAIRLREEDREILATGRSSATIRNHLAADGRQSFWLIIKFPILDPQGRAFIGGIAVDITEQRECERQILRISEREQERIGQDLHDGLCQHLAGIKFKTALLKQKMNVPSHVRGAKVIEAMLKTAIDHAHRLARGLNPVQLEANGLSSALKELAANLGTVYGCACIFVMRKPVLIHENSIAVHLYRIAQEAITNAIKHGRAKKILVELARTGNDITLSVDDDGRGISRRQARKNGMGLHIMNYRARTIGATLKFSSKPTHGTLVTCTLPHAHQ